MTANEQEPQLNGADKNDGKPVESGRKDKAAGKPARSKSEARRAWIMRGLITPILGLLAVTCIALGLLNATIWKPSREITAATSVSGVQYVTTDPGVLSLVDSQAELTVSSASSGDNVCVALGSGKDINGWLAGSAYARVTGMSSWTQLSIEQVKASGTSDASGSSDESSAVAFKDSDMWTKVSCGNGTVTMKTDVSSSSPTMAVIDLGKSGKADVSLHWVRQTLPDFAVPFYFAGGLLAVMAALTASLFAMPPHKRRKRTVAGTAVQAEEVKVSEAIAGSWSAIRPKPASETRRSRRRHASHRITDTGTILPVETTGSQPTIVDPASRNLVAEAADAAGADDAATSEPVNHEQPATEPDKAQPEQQTFDEAATSVITPAELQAYFARLAQESGTTNDEEAK